MNNKSEGNYFAEQIVAKQQEEINKLQRRLSLLKQRNCMLSEENKRLFVLQQILRLVPEHVYWKDVNSVYQGCNEQFAKMFGFDSANNVIGRKEQELLGGANLKAVENDAEIIRTNKPMIVEEVAKDVNGNDRVFLSHKTPLYDRNNTICGIVGISVDITDRRKMEKELAKAKERAEFSNQVKTEMIRNLSHDIRTPLAGMIGQANLIAAEYPKTQEEMQELRAAAERLLKLLNTIMDVSQLESGSVIEKFTPFSMKDLVEEVITCFKPAAKEKKLQLKSYIDGEMPAQILGNYHFLHRIIFNLVGNALKFTDKGAVSVHVESTQKEKHNLLLKITIKDTGIGILKDKQAIIFEPFNRLTPSYENRYPGNGLGLYMVSELVRKLGGEIYVDSIVNEGSTFKMLLPVKTALVDTGELKTENLMPEPEKTERPIVNNTVAQPEVSLNTLDTITDDNDQKQIRVLLVEDDMLAQKTGVYNLNKWGYKVETASNGTQALEKTLNKQFDFIYMDLGLPDLGGEKVTQEIRKDKYNLNQNTPIVALTAHADDEIKKECLSLGMNEVLQKSMEEETTRKVITQYTKELAIIDLEEGARIINADEMMAKDTLEMLVQQLPEQLQAINEAFASQDNEQLQHHVHKLHGSACYCGVPRLRLAAKMLEHTLRSKQYQNIPPLFNKLVVEINSFLEAWAKLN